MPFIVEWARRDERPDVAALSFSLISLATTFGALVGGFLPSLVSLPIPAIESASLEAYRVTLVTGSLIGVCGLVPLFLMGQARQRKPPVDHAAARAAEDPGTRRQTKRDVTAFVAIGGLMALGAGMVIPFYNVYLKSLGASTREVGYVYALGGFSAAAIGLAAPAVSRRLGSLRAVGLLRLSILPFYLLLILTPTTWVAVLAYLARQTSISMAWPIDSTFIAEVLPARARASVFGLRSAAWNIGFSGASLVGGRIIVTSGYDLTFASLIVFSALAAVFFVAYFARHPRVRAGQIPSALPLGQRRGTAPVSPDAEATATTGGAV
jgi:predicted MFS family arabinose efflux permease